MNKKCNFCGNSSYKNKYVQYIYKKNGNIFVVNDVPCEECDYCGEQYFEAKILKMIEKEYEEIFNQNKQINTIKVPIASFENLV